MIPFLRSDLNQWAAYGAESSADLPTPYDKLDANEVSVDLPETLKQELGEFLTQSMAANRYPDGEYRSLKHQLSCYTGMPMEGISLGNGSDELIRSLLIAACLGRGGILVADPTFSMYQVLAGTLGIPVHRVGRSATDFTIDIVAAQRVVESQNIAAVFVVHPNSPTGNLLQPDEVQWLRSLPEDILVVIDEAYYEFSRTSLTDQLADHPNWVVLRTFSKAFRLAAFRVGYALGSLPLIAALEKIRLPYNLPTLAAVAAEWALHRRTEILGLVEEIITERDGLSRSLAAIPSLNLWPSHANFVYGRTPHDRELMEYLKTQGTLIRHTGGGLRITIGTPAENRRTIERIKSYFAS